MVEIKPIDFIKEINESDSYIEMIYLNGGCYSFYKVLKLVFPNASPFINKSKDHVVTMIDGKLYDIRGNITGDYSPLTIEDILMCENWSFSRNHWLYKESPNCEDMISAIAQ